MPSTPWFHLTHRGILRLTGADCLKLLQGLVTNDVNLASEDRVIYSLLLSPQGRFQHDFFIGQNGIGEFFLTPELSRIDDLIKKLSMYKLKSDVAIENISADFFLVWQPHESTNTPGTILQAPPSLIFIDPRNTAMGMHALVPKGDFSEDFALYHRKRLTLGIPEGSLDMIVDKAIPLENNMDDLNAISWTKGCYMGQELTSRTKHVGEVRKKLFPVVVEGPLPTFDASLFYRDEEVGLFKSGFEKRGLALIRIENLEGISKEGLSGPSNSKIFIAF